MARKEREVISTLKITIQLIHSQDLGSTLAKSKETTSKGIILSTSVIRVDSKGYTIAITPALTQVRQVDSKVLSKSNKELKRILPLWDETLVKCQEYVAPTK